MDRSCPDCGKGCCSIDFKGRCVGNCLGAPATHAREVETTRRLFRSKHGAPVEISGKVGVGSSTAAPRRAARSHHSQ